MPKITNSNLYDISTTVHVSNAHIKKFQNRYVSGLKTPIFLAQTIYQNLLSVAEELEFRSLKYEESF